MSDEFDGFDEVIIIIAMLFVGMLFYSICCYIGVF